jgi:predicted HAD superfamily Cof-like phosphohydrolase
MNGKSQHYELVAQFMRMAKQEVPDAPFEPSPAVRLLRAKLILEEAMETCAALGVSITHQLVEEGEEKDALLDFDALHFTADGEFNLAEVVDGCCDIKVVTTGTLVAVGVKDQEAQQVVDFNNLLKFGVGHTLRADGKLVKPPGHLAPDIERVIKGQLLDRQRTRLPGERLVAIPSLPPRSEEIAPQPIHPHTPH